MLKIIGFDKQGQSNQIRFDNDGQFGAHIFIDGQLEQYMGAFGIGAGAALTVVMADAHLEGYPCPDMDDPQAKSKIARTMAEAPPQFEWGIDRDEMLAKMTLADDVAEQVRSSWALATEKLVVKDEDHTAIVADRQAAYVQDQERRQDELRADDMMEEYKPQAPTFNTGLVPPQ